MAMGSTWPLTEMSTRNLPGAKGPLVHKADNRSSSVSQLSRNCGNLDISQPYGPVPQNEEIHLKAFLAEGKDLLSRGGKMLMKYLPLYQVTFLKVYDVSSLKESFICTQQAI
jgi:hypothetical protein